MLINQLSLAASYGAGSLSTPMASSAPASSFALAYSGVCDQNSCAPAESESPNWSFAAALTSNFEEPVLWPPSSHGDGEGSAAAAARASTASTQASQTRGESVKTAAAQSGNSCKADGRVGLDHGLPSLDSKPQTCCDKPTPSKSSECKADSSSSKDKSCSGNSGGSGTGGSKSSGGCSSGKSN